MMHQDSLEPAAIRFTLERLQESARRSGCSLPAFSFIGKVQLYGLKQNTLRVMQVT